MMAATLHPLANLGMDPETVRDIFLVLVVLPIVVVGAIFYTVVFGLRAISRRHRLAPWESADDGTGIERSVMRVLNEVDADSKNELPEEPSSAQSPE